MIAAIHTVPDTYLDHIAVLARLLNIPLIYTEESSQLLVEKYYPGTILIKKEMHELTVEFFACNFDALIVCGRFWAQELLPSFEIQHRKKMRIFLCPHGNSDKGYSKLDPIKHPFQDAVLIYGDHMKELVESNGAIKKIRELICIGNYRFHDYQLHKAFYDRLIEEQYGLRLDPDKKTLLYAPTWNDGENPSSFFSSCLKLVQELSPFFNLMIKPHPFLEEYAPAETIWIQQQCSNFPNVLWIESYPPIYPLLNRADAYFGDFSSIGYDFLAFNRPLYFIHDLENSIYLQHPQCLIQHCGRRFSTGDIEKLGNRLVDFLEEDQELFSARRMQTYTKAFAPYKAIATLIKEPSHT